MTTRWYRDGTISVTNGTTAVTGVGTVWATAGVIQPGDLFTFDGAKMYEIASVEDNTHLTLASPYTGTTLTNSVYAIIINFSVRPSSEVLGKSLLLINKWMVREQELLQWQTQPTGTVTFHAWDGSTSTYKSLPQIIADISSVDWSELTGIPTEFTPAAHTQDWTTITGKPATFAPSAHTHAGSDITSGTVPFARLHTSGTANSAGFLRGDGAVAASITNNFTLSAATTESRGLEIGAGRTGDGFSYLDFIGDATYSDFGLRVSRSSGANGSSGIEHRGTGTLILNAADAGTISLRISGSSRLTIATDGKVSFPVAGAVGGLSHGAGINGASGSARRFRVFTDGLIRWEWGTDGTPESTGNVGSPFVITRYDDAGASLGTTLTINRATAAWTIASAGFTVNHTGATFAGGNTTFSGGTFTVNGGNIVNNQGAYYCDALAGANAHYWLRDDADVAQGLFFWDRGADAIKIRRYDTAGTAAEGELVLTANDLTWKGAKVLTDAARSSVRTDWNTMTETGFHRMGGNIIDGATIDGADHDLIHLQGGGGDASQLAFTTGNQLYFRVKDDGTTFGAWRQVWHDGNLTIGNYMPKTGGTFTGQVIIDGTAQPLVLKAGATADHLYIQFYADSQDQATRSGYIGWGAAGSTTLNIVNQFASGDINLTPGSGGKVNVAGNVNITGNGGITFNGKFQGNTGLSLGTTAGNSVDLGELNGTTSNNMKLVTRLHRRSAGSDWTTAAVELRARTDGTDQTFIRFGGNPGNTIFFGDGTTERYTFSPTNLIAPGDFIANAGGLFFGSQVRQHINLYNTDYGIGVQSNTQYFRSFSRFSWFKNGVHSTTENDPGAGGTSLMTLEPGGDLYVAGRIKSILGHFNATSGAAVVSGVSSAVYLRPAGPDNPANEVSAQGDGLHVTSGWVRSYGNTGWYSQTHGGGWYMTDGTWLRTYNGKGVLVTGPGSNDFRIESSAPTMVFYDTDEGYTSWIHHNSGNHGFLAHNAFAWACYRSSTNDWLCNANIIAYASDRRLKTNIRDARMDRVNQIILGTRIRDYDWDAVAIDHYKVSIQPKEDQLGAIAQEVQAVFPDAVVVNESHNPIDGDPIDILTIQWEKFVPALIAKMQEQERRIAELEALWLA